jgi:hypothetical protein
MIENIESIHTILAGTYIQLWGPKWLRTQTCLNNNF